MNSSATVLLIGSYNGQDSFGDKCLLRCVVAQLQGAFGDDVATVHELHENIREAQLVSPSTRFELGLSAVFRAWLNKLRHLHLPVIGQITIAVLTWPFWLVATKDNRAVIGRVWREVRDCGCLYFYGGTQLSEQWFALNFPPLILMLVLCRLAGKPVFWGPQQYGPQSSAQRWWVRFALDHFVTDVSVRNTQCLDLLATSRAKLLFDEVYSCRRRYPVRDPQPRPCSFILINLRGSNFLRHTTTAEFQAFVALVKALYARLGLPYKLFQMSGDTFCNDTGVLALLREHVPVEMAPPFEREEDLIELAGQAFGAFSMSFHGCVLSMIGGCPAVPITSGGYYDYKYVDFARYTGGQQVPVVDLEAQSANETAEMIAGYFVKYDPNRTAAARRRAAEQIEGWYQSVRQRVNGRAGC